MALLKQVISKDCRKLPFVEFHLLCLLHFGVEEEGGDKGTEAAGGGRINFSPSESVHSTTRQLSLPEWV